MQTLEQKLKTLDRAKEELDVAISAVFAAGGYVDEVDLKNATNKFYNLRWAIGREQEKIKILASNLRSEAQDESKRTDSKVDGVES